MKILQDISHEAEYIGDVKENRVGIDRDNIDFITTLLTSNLYSKPLESFLRETVANAYDSHIEANNDEYILLIITKTGWNKYTISVRDYGVGVSPERFDQIYRNIGSSTKRDSNDYIGAFGIGRFAGLSCADTVNINSYYNNIKYSYIMYKNGKGINIDKISELQGDFNKPFKNGLEVSISISCQEKDLQEAIGKLILFKKLHIEYIDKNSGDSSYFLRSTIEEFNSRTITDFKTFSMCTTLNRGRYLRVGNILYDNLDLWNDLHTESGIIINIPIGEVDITPNREELQFTDRTKNTISHYVDDFKKELQEIVSNIQSTDFTLKQFYGYAVSNYIEYKYLSTSTNDYSLNIYKEDVRLDFTSCNIKGKPIPENFNVFFKDLRILRIDKSYIYKVCNPGKRYGWRILNMGNMLLSSIFEEEAFIGVKLDSVTKAVTLQWYKDECIGDACVAVLYDLKELKEQIRHFLYNWNQKELEICIDYLFDIIEIYNLANDSVPESYKKSYKEKHKKVKIKDSNESDIPIRLYNCSSYTMMYLKHLPKEGTVIYTAHTKEDSNIVKLAHLLSPLSIVNVITVRKEYFPLFEKDKRFILLEDFLDFPNNILKKIVTARIIMRSFYSISTTNNNFNSVPIVKEFHKKYLSYIMANNTPVAAAPGIKEILDRYEAKGWYNKADVAYFSISDTDKDALNTIQYMQENRSEIIRCMAFFIFGKNSRIGINKPYINICKYLKKFKYECI